MNPTIQEETPISVYDLQKELKAIKKRNEELGLRSTKTQEYIDQFTPLKEKEAEELEKKITELNVPRLKDVHVKKIVELLPASVEELKVIVQGYTLTVTKDNMQKIISEIEKYLPKE